MKETARVLEEKGKKGSILEDVVHRPPIGEGIVRVGMSIRISVLLLTFEFPITGKVTVRFVSTVVIPGY